MIPKIVIETPNGVVDLLPTSPISAVIFWALFGWVLVEFAWTMILTSKFYQGRGLKTIIFRSSDFKAEQRKMFRRPTRRMITAFGLLLCYIFAGEYFGLIDFVKLDG